jgi:DNA-binding transcriptional ArsR family regulator
MDQVFRALADSSRRQLLDRLNGHSGPTLREVCAVLEGVSQDGPRIPAALKTLLESGRKPMGV